MVSVVQRMRKLKTLQNIRLGPGAAILPSSTTPSSSSRSKIGPITRLHLSYAQKMYGGHQGARKFWRICLPRLKYHNPALPMTVKQTGEETDPAVMTIYYNVSPETAWEKGASSSEPTSTTKTTPTPKNIEDKNAPRPAMDEKTATLDMKGKQFEQVWASFREMTGAEDVDATEEDKGFMEDMEAHKVKADKDRKIVTAIHKENKDRERMLQEAKGMVQKMKE